MRNYALARAMEEVGLSAHGLAARVGLERKTVYSWTEGHRFPRTDAAIRTARVLGCTVEELFGGLVADYGEVVAE